MNYVRTIFLAVLAVAVAWQGQCREVSDTVAGARMTVQDSATIARQTAEVEALLAAARARQQRQQQPTPRQRLDAMLAPSAQPLPRFSLRQLILPASLLALGTWMATDDCFDHFNDYTRRHLRHHHRVSIDDYLQYGPMAMKMGLNLFSGDRRYNTGDRVLANLTSVALMYGCLAALRPAVGEARPDDPASHNSYPSGHVARAFRSAESIRIEYGPWWGLGGYAMAATVAWLRLRNDRHWVADVVGGAAIGMLCARAGYWLVPLERRLLGLDHPGGGSAQAVVVPYCQPAFGNGSGISAGASLAIVF